MGGLLIILAIRIKGISNKRSKHTTLCYPTSETNTYPPLHYQTPFIFCFGSGSIPQKSRRSLWLPLGHRSGGGSRGTSMMCSYSNYSLSWTKPSSQQPQKSNLSCSQSYPRSKSEPNSTNPSSCT